MKDITKVLIVTGILICMMVGCEIFATDIQRPVGLPWDKAVVKFSLSDGFWAKRGNQIHGAWDCPMPIGTPIKARFDGRIEFNWSPKAGRYMVVKNGHWEDTFMHLSKFDSSNIDHGNVKFGDVIGFSGSSGESTGPHLHWSVTYNGVKINPQETIK